MHVETVTVVTPTPAHVFILASPAGAHPLMEPGFHAFLAALAAFMALSDASALIILSRAAEVRDTARILVGTGGLIASTSILVVALEMYTHTVHAAGGTVRTTPLPEWLIVPIYATVLGTVVSAVGMTLYLWRAKLGRTSVVEV